MIYRIVGYSMLFCLFLAIGLSAFGYTHVDIGTSFLAFMRNVNNDVVHYKFDIPNIPTIPRFDVQGIDGNDILSVLKRLANGLIFFVNMIITTFNLIVGLVNIVLEVGQYIIAILINAMGIVRNTQGTPAPSIPFV